MAEVEWVHRYQDKNDYNFFYLTLRNINNQLSKLLPFSYMSVPLSENVVCRQRGWLDIYVLGNNFCGIFYAMI